MCLTIRRQCSTQSPLKSRSRLSKASIPRVPRKLGAEWRAGGLSARKVLSRPRRKKKLMDQYCRSVGSSAVQTQARWPAGRFSWQLYQDVVQYHQCGWGRGYGKTRTRTLEGCMVSVRVLFYLRPQEASLLNHTVTIFLYSGRASWRIPKPLLVAVPYRHFLPLCPIWALICARALRRDRSVSPTDD